MRGAKSNKEVIAGVTLLADRAMRRMARDYRAAVSAPLLEAVREAKSFDGARKRLSAALVNRMGTEPVEESLGGAGIQAALIGDAAARPLKKATKRRSDGATKGR